jgi:hypothetical protein
MYLLTDINTKDSTLISHIMVWFPEGGTWVVKPPRRLSAQLLQQVQVKFFASSPEEEDVLTFIHTVEQLTLDSFFLNNKYTIEHFNYG